MIHLEKSSLAELTESCVYDTGEKVIYTKMPLSTELSGRRILHLFIILWERILRILFL